MSILAGVLVELSMYAPLPTHDNSAIALIVIFTLPVLAALLIALCHRRSKVMRDGGEFTAGVTSSSGL